LSDCREGRFLLLGGELSICCHGEDGLAFFSGLAFFGFGSGLAFFACFLPSLVDILSTRFGISCLVSLDELGLGLTHVVGRARLTLRTEDRQQMDSRLIAEGQQMDRQQKDRVEGQQMAREQMDSRRTAGQHKGETKVDRRSSE
jgi:hypothetical protein